MLNFVLCDDNQSILDRLCKMLESLYIKHNFDAEIVFSSTTPESALEYVRNNNVNVLFLDIDLKSKMSGLDLASQVRKINKQVYIIFTSAHLEYVLIAYQYKTFDFIPKPITIERLEETFLRIVDDIKADYKKSNFIRIDNRNTIINEDNEVIENNKDIMGGKEYTSNNIFSELFDVNPVPSNKLYDLELIKKAGLFFGNVRIGQDLNFYLKYLLICKKISTIDRGVYKYRIVSNSMSRMKSFRIFDIVESFNDVKKFYKINKSLEVYQNYIQVLELRHYHRQMEKQISFKARDERKTIVTYFKIQEKKLDYKLMKNFNNYYKNIYFRFKIKTKLSFLYYSKMYSTIKRVVKR